MNTRNKNVINPEFADLFIEERYNPFRECIQGLSNETDHGEGAITARR